MRTLKGGRFLGEGSYGCVIKPALPCTKKQSKTLNVLKKSVSKIIINPDENLDLEIKINNMLIKLDPYKHFFITPLDICYLNNNILSGRKDIEQVEWNTSNNNNDGSIHYFELESENAIKLKDKNRCRIDMNTEPINIMMPYGGYTLDDLFKKKNTNKNKNLKHKTMHSLKISFFRNFKSNFKHLLKGLKIMHDVRIVHRDIKPENMMISFSKNLKSSHKSSNVLNTMSTKSLKSNTTSKTHMRYIDFGLSSHITNDLIKFDNIDFTGTPRYIPPDLYIIFYQAEYSYDDKQSIMDEVNKDLDKYYRKIMKKYKLHDLLHNYHANLNALYDKFLQQYDNNTLLKKYFGSGDNKYNGYLQKGDVFGLGISMIELFSYIRKNNPHITIPAALYDLLIKMIAFDPEDRYNVNQCLAHPYFA